MSKVDFKKELKHLYQTSKNVVFVDVPEMKFLMVDGTGDPNKAPGFQEAVAALYGVSFTVKFMFKKQGKLHGYPDWVVPPLEGLWWCEDMKDFNMESKDEWKWTLMIMQPEFVTGEIIDRAVNELKAKKNPPGIAGVRLETFREGLSGQVLHIGPYSAEGPTIERLHNVIREKGYGLRGKHHEIYLSDPRRTAPEKWKTIIRQPCQ
ncbi:MAG: GyrI-like domain-containing protein [Bacillota bacterium]